jgi:NAD(P)-dependent dehydrogenase (short-subunit alcohol dehydrogenase family)
MSAVPDDRAGKDLTGKAAVVTGGGSGIGRATALLLAGRGASVLVADIDGANAEKVAAEIGVAASHLQVDVTDVAAVDAMVQQAVSSYGGLHIAINNAGTSGQFGATADVDPAEWRRVIDLNLNGVFLCMRAEIPAILAAGGGAIVNTSSGAGLMGFAGLPAYVASKHGVIGLTRAAALEYSAQGIRVNCVCPGTVRTPMLEAFTGDEATLQAMGRAMPIKRLATPEEIAEAMVWLASPAASYVTGHALAVDGGASAQ